MAASLRWLKVHVWALEAAPPAAVLLTGGFEGGVLVEAHPQVVVRVGQGHGRTQGGQRRVVQVVVICGRHGFVNIFQAVIGFIFASFSFHLKFLPSNE